MTRVFRYLVLDVFTREPFGGNPLAVFPDATGMSDAEMQALARELNLSETAFCLPALDLDAARTHGTRVRIFTTQEELPFAGHPTLGTAAALRLFDPAWQGSREVRLQLHAGVVPVRFTEETPAPASAASLYGVPLHGVMEQPLPVFGRVHDPAHIAPLLGLPVSALDAQKPVQTVSTGLPFVIVMLRSVAELGGMRLRSEDAEAYLREDRNRDAGMFFYVLAPDSGDGTRWRARMQFYGGEDPATGSAAGCATSYLVRHGYAPASTALRIVQGVETGRVSEMECSAQLDGEDADVTTTAGKENLRRYVRVGGSTVPVAEGHFFLR